jgi:dUTP pyrophosphatase
MRKRSLKSGDEPGAPEVLLKILPHGQGVVSPVYATAHSVGMDLAAAVDGEMTISPGQTGLVPTGIVMAVPLGYEAQVRPRSGLAVDHGILIPNSPGTVDPDYRGEIKVVLLNMGSRPFIVSRGMRIAQMVIAPAVQAAVRVVDELPPTERGKGGFGHSGV